MKNILLLILLGINTYAVQVFWHDSYEEGAHEATSEHKPMLVFMSQAGCKSCEYMEDTVLREEKVSAYINTNYIAVHLDIHDNDAPKRLQVPVTPVFHFLHSDGSERKESLMGGKTAPFFIKEIQLP
jgi:thioredoxin-related protein